MSRDPHIQETGSYGIEDDDVNTDGVWSNNETGRQHFGGQITVGEQAMSVALGDARESPGGFHTNDMATEGQVARRESRRPPRGFDDPNMSRESFTLATEEQIESEAEQDRLSTEIAERHVAIEQEAADEGVDIPSRAEKCRQDVTSTERYSRTVGHGWFDAHTEPVTAEHEGDDRVSKHDPITPSELERDTTNPFEEANQEIIAEANQGAKELEDYFGTEPTPSRSVMSKLLVQRMLNGQDPTTAIFSLRDSIEESPKVRQPISNIDAFGQDETTVVGTIETLWFPKGDGQRQVGLISDDSGEQIKITVWHRAGNKPTLKEGDKVRVVRCKVNAYKSNGEWQTTLAVVADTEIHHHEHGDGPGTRDKQMSETRDLAAWKADSDTHQWLINQGEDDSKTVSMDPFEVTHHQQERTLPEEGHHTMDDFKESLNIGPESDELCPECGSANTSSYQQQTGGADEGMTGFHSCADCNHKWRSGYGA